MLYSLPVSLDRSVVGPLSIIISPQVGVRGRDAGCPAPPARIRTCALTHPAPALSPDGKSLRRPRVQDGDAGPELPTEGVETLPWEVAPL